MNQISTSALWAPFTPMRQFNRQPMLFESAEGMHYTTTQGHRVLDAMAGLGASTQVTARHVSSKRSAKRRDAWTSSLRSR